MGGNRLGVLGSAFYKMHKRIKSATKDSKAPFSILELNFGLETNQQKPFRISFWWSEWNFPLKWLEEKTMGIATWDITMSTFIMKKCCSPKGRKHPRVDSTCHAQPGLEREFFDCWWATLPNALYDLVLSSNTQTHCVIVRSVVG